MTLLDLRLLAISIMLFTSLSALSAESINIKKIWKDGKSFTINKTSSIETGQHYLLLDDANATQAIAKISVCKTKTCLASIVMSKKAFQLKETYQLILAEKSSIVHYQGYLGYGGPLGAGIKLGYAGNFLKNKWIIGGNFTRQKSSDNNLDIMGNMLSAELRYPIFQIEKLKISALAEIGVMKLTLKFTEDSQGPSKDATTYFMITGVDLAYPITKSLEIIGKALISKNGLESSYSNSSNQNYSNPYGKILISSELGIRYTF